MASDLISFARGAPSADILPAASVRKAAERALTEDWEAALSYGTGVGHPGLREWIAAQHGVEVDRVMVTNGSLEAAVLLFEHLLSPGDGVAVEQPSYDRTLLLFRRVGAEMLGVPLEDDGLDVGAFETAVASRPKLAHVIPNFQNPAGCTLSEEKRRRVLELAAAQDVLVFEDDPYARIWFDAEPPPSMLSMDNGDRVVFASSFSKTVSPGVRIGYLVGPQELIAALSKRASENYISPNMLAESIVWDLCRTGALEENIEVVRTALRERRDLLRDALERHIPEAEFVLPGGGYFLWLTLAEDVNCGELIPTAKEEGVAFLKGADFMLEGGTNSLRLSFASVPADRVEEGVQRLARALGRVRQGAPA